MHRRFRNGLQKMIAYYETSSTEVEQDNEDMVLVIVTHQAGCNALIRLLTGAPALHEVGTASLTMAIRKPEDEKMTLTPPSPTRRRGSLDSGISSDYDVKIIASTEHLRAASNPLGLNSPRLGFSPAFASRRAVGADAPEGFSLGDPVPGRGMSAVPARRSSERPHAADELPAGENPTGLWRRGSRYSRDETADSSDAGVTPSTNSAETNESGPEPESIPDDANTLKVDTRHLPVRSASQRGLWGGESISRERSPGKRRWTAVERSP